MSKSRALFVALLALLASGACYLLVYTDHQQLGLIVIALTTAVSFRDFLEKIDVKKSSMKSVILSAAWGALSFILLKGVIDDPWTPYFLMALGGLSAICGLLIIILLTYLKFGSRGLKA